MNVQVQANSEMQIHEASAVFQRILERGAQAVKEDRARTPKDDTHEPLAYANVWYFTSCKKGKGNLPGCDKEK